jgi:hypothetical protein
MLDLGLPQESRGLLIFLLCRFFFINCFIKLFLLLVHATLRVGVIGSIWKELAVEIVNQFLELFTLFLRFFDEEVYTSVTEVLKIMFNSLLAKFPFS